MKKYTKDELASIYKARREKLFEYMTQNKITAVIFEDCEERRDPALLPGRRLRRREARQELLHRVRQAGSRRYGHPDPGMRQVPLQ